MELTWWDEAHAKLWRITDSAELLNLRDKARQTACETVAPLLARARDSRGWTEEKARVLGALDAQGLTRILVSAHHGLTLPLALAVWELASVDAGVATSSLSGSLAQMPIRDFGTLQQRDRYLGLDNLRHGALCLTEPIPGAGADAISLSGRMVLAGAGADGETLLEIHKRGRFISHMDFAEFVVAAVEGDGNGVRGSGLVILEPGDAGEFERGAPVRKLGHLCASTTDPVFRLRVPASRVVGGYTMEEGALVPLFSHRALLEPALRRMRALLALMTAAKALSTVKDGFEFIPTDERRASFACAWPIFGLPAKPRPRWASLPRVSAMNSIGRRILPAPMPGWPRSSLPRQSSSAAAGSPSVCGKLACCIGYGAPPGLDLRSKLIDTQVEEMYMGPAALQRRLVSAAMTGTRFLAEFQKWTGEMDVLAGRLPRAGLRSLAEGMRLWHWTLEQLQHQADARGAKLYRDARQGVTFAMADALCGLLAARSLALCAFDMEMDCRQPGRESSSIFLDLSTLAAGRAAARGMQTCMDLLFGYAERFPVSGAERRAAAELRADLCVSLRGTMDARERIAKFLRTDGRRNANSGI